jgi:hypothetical protein
MADREPRYARKRRNAALEMQQSAFIQLSIAAVLFFILIIGATYLFMMPLRQGSVRGVAPLLGGFMEAGRDRDVLAGHALFSAQGLTNYSRDELADLYAERRLFEGYDRLKVTSFETYPNDDPFVPKTAVVAAVVHYDTGQPARLEAELDLEETTWRIRTVRYSRDPNP